MHGRRLSSTCPLARGGMLQVLQKAGVKAVGPPRIPPPSLLREPGVWRPPPAPGKAHAWQRCLGTEGRQAHRGAPVMGPRATGLGPRQESFHTHPRLEGAKLWAGWPYCTVLPSRGETSGHPPSLPVLRGLGWGQDPPPPLPAGVRFGLSGHTALLWGRLHLLPLLQFLHPVRGGGKERG